uniref:Putative histone-lysine N-methyltransferase NSD2 n=1 Tax=Aceria tosichella TaxID=561515 RepID=A0A6G1SFA6_9ACAR
MADEDPNEYEKKLLANFPLLESKPLHTVRIPLTDTVRSIRTRDELINMPPRKETEGPYNVGDLLWVKMPGYPHWPAMISRDPIDGRFYKRSQAVGFTYHVQYFAEATRGWIKPKTFWPFEGPYLNISGKPALPKQRKKHHEEAISEAVQALKMEPLARLKRLTFNYILTDPKTPQARKTTPSGKKRRTPSKAKAAKDESIYDFDETNDDFEPDDKPSELIWSRPREATPPRDETPPRSQDEDGNEIDNLPATPIMATDDSVNKTDEQPEVDEEKCQSDQEEKVAENNDNGTLEEKEELEPIIEEKPKPQQTPRRTRSAPRREMSPINNNNSSSRPNKRMRGSSVVKRVAPPPPDAMTSSEDASSTSDLEAPDVRLDKLCNVCHDETGPFYFCSGTCLRTMHAACGGSESTNNNSDNFICQECKTGKHPCFVCKSADGDCVKCCHKNCGKYYHIACLNPQSYPANIKSEKTFTCPMHHCLTCYTDQPYPRDINCLKPCKRQLLKCLSCPTAFHNDDACTAAGTVVLAGNFVMCPAHRSTKNEKHINVSWCFSCNEGGNLICCESCPAAFHAECIDNPPKSDEQYFCYDCQNRKQLHYGDIIWIKLGAYRWWPAKIIHPHTVPDNIMKLNHTRGDFPVYFFGSHDYYWSHKGRVFVFVEEDGQLKGKSGSSDKKFKIAVQEARAEYVQRQIKEEERREKWKKMEKPNFRLIKQNRPINDVVQSTPDDLKLSSKPRCECKPDGDVLCGTDECLNRLMMLECDPSTCPAKEKCKNQRFRKRQYPICIPFRTDNVGWGLRTTQDIKKGDFVIEYVGELIDEAECNRRMEEKMDRGDTTFYFLTIDKERIIDAGPAANHARFMNHSCQPNCETQKWVVNGQTKVGLFAICDIPAGTELTFNYNLDCRGNEKMQCRCNSENCSGYIGLPVKSNKKPS